MDFSAQQLAVLLVGGFVAGIVNGTIGGGSLLTYPLLVFSGLPPVLAAATNTTGLSPGNAAALVAHRKGETITFRHWKAHAWTNAAGALAGGILLIALPEKVFEFIVPVLLLAASLATLLKPRPSHHEPAARNLTLSRLFASGIYQGYFGPGQGVLAMAVLLRDGRLSVHQAVVVKNLVIFAGNLVVSLLFILSGHVVWAAAIALMFSVTVGGWSGGHLAKRLNPNLLRYGVAAVGFVSAVWFVRSR